MRFLFGMKQPSSELVPNKSFQKARGIGVKEALSHTRFTRHFERSYDIWNNTAPAYFDASQHFDASSALPNIMIIIKELLVIDNQKYPISPYMES